MQGLQEDLVDWHVVEWLSLACEDEWVASVLSVLSRHSGCVVGHGWCARADRADRVVGGSLLFHVATVKVSLWLAVVGSAFAIFGISVGSLAIERCFDVGAACPLAGQTLRHLDSNTTNHKW
jgi:hypothetical protein